MSNVGPQLVKQVVFVSLWSRRAPVRFSSARKFASVPRVASGRASSVRGRVVRPLAARSPSACRRRSECAGRALHEHCATRVQRRGRAVPYHSRHAGLSDLRRPAGGRSGSQQRRFRCRLNLGLSRPSTAGQAIVSRASLELHGLRSRLVWLPSANARQIRPARLWPNPSIERTF